MKISLVGYMGSGKTTIGKLLSAHYNVPFYDLDHYIETQEKATISQIFEQKKELYFRKKEHQYLKEILQKDNFVLSTGGGTPIFYNNMDLLNLASTTINLSANPTELSHRLSAEKHHRPLIAHLENEQIPEFIAKHLFERNPHYQKAQIIINTNQKLPEQIAQEIIEKITLTNEN